MNKLEVLQLAKRVKKSPKRVGAKKLAEWLLAHSDWLREPEIYSYLEQVHAVKLGTPKEFTMTFTISMLGEARSFWARHVIAITPAYGFVVLRDAFGVPGQNEDAFIYAPNAFRFDLDLPPIRKNEPLEVRCVYTGLVPMGFIQGDPFDFALRLSGKVLPS